MEVTSQLLDRRKFLLTSLGLSAVAATGCGTIFHPERRGQCSGRMDWKIVALNAVGLVFFLIPGAIAFAVDFYTGAIYLPPCDVGMNPSTDEPLVVRHIPREDISRKQIEEVVSNHTGQKIDLEENNYTSEPLNSIDEFWQKVRRLTGNRNA